MKRQAFLKGGILGLFALGLNSFKLEKIPSEKSSILPPPLKKGDSVALFAPAGAIFNSEHISKLKNILNKQGYKVVLAENLDYKNGYLAGSDKERLDAFHALIKNKEVKALIAVRGGWGCARFIKNLDLNLIKANPKIIMGYSDLTSLLNYITDETGIITYHGPMAYSTWNNLALSEFNARFVEQQKNVSLLKLDTDNYSNNKGSAQGILCGGNLTVLSQMLGTHYSLNVKNKILFLEETNEEPYVIDRMLTQLRDSDYFKNVNGIVLGKFHKCVPEIKEKSISLLEVFDYHFKELDIPVFGFANFGHVKDKYILDIGRMAKINSANFRIDLL